MNLSPADQVRIRRLLLLREAAFDDLSRIEQAITELAGGAYPFAAPAVIPRSLQTGARPRSGKKMPRRN